MNYRFNADMLAGVSAAGSRFQPLKSEHIHNQARHTRGTLIDFYKHVFYLRGSFSAITPFYQVDFAANGIKRSLELMRHQHGILIFLYLPQSDPLVSTHEVAF